jgi:dCMP deaminase
MTNDSSDDHRPSWDETWIQVAETIGLRSRCSRSRLGSVIVSKEQRICATGYNGPAANWPHLGECAGWCPRARGESPLDNMYDSCPAIHAEANALMYVDRSSVVGGTLYVTSAPCMQCAKLISNSGLARVVCRLRKTDEHRRPLDVIKYLRDCNIIVDIIKDDDVDYC